MKIELLCDIGMVERNTKDLQEKKCILKIFHMPGAFREKLPKKFFNIQLQTKVAFKFFKVLKILTSMFLCVCFYSDVCCQIPNDTGSERIGYFKIVHSTFPELGLNQNCKKIIRIGNNRKSLKNLPFQPKGRH